MTAEDTYFVSPKRENHSDNPRKSGSRNNADITNSSDEPVSENVDDGGENSEDAIKHELSNIQRKSLLIVIVLL